MKGYPLKALLEIRESERDAAERALGTAAKHLRAFEAEVVSAQERCTEVKEGWHQARRELDGAMSDGAPIRTMRGLSEYLEGLKVEMREREAELIAARAQVRGARLVLARTRRELETAQRALLGVEKHHEAWEAGMRRIRGRQEANDMDEVAIRTWMEEQG